VRLVACQTCHTQYDVSDVVEKSISCRCGETIENAPPVVARDVAIHRCGSCGAQLSADASACDYCSSEIVRDDSKLSLICPECHGRNCEDSRFCTGCGVAFAPEPVKVDGFELPCPVCGCLMPPRQIGGIGINECSSCNGLWAPGERFDELIHRAVQAHKSADPEKMRAFKPRVKGSNPTRQKVVYRKCPECDAFMQRRNFQRSSGVIIDRCHEHGTWLDADELEQITGFLSSGGRPGGNRIHEEADRAAREAQRSVMLGSVEHSAWRALSSSSYSSRGLGGGVAGTLLGVFASLLD
jgi:Zn-finger nucleic acid-binding protein